MKIVTFKLHLLYGKIREVIAYQDHFENFLKAQTEKVQNKIFKVIEAIETLERVPETYLKPIKKRKGYMKQGFSWHLIYGGCFVFSMKESL